MPLNKPNQIYTHAHTIYIACKRPTYRIIELEGRTDPRKKGRTHFHSNIDKLMLRSHIHEYGHVRNRHIMFITIEHIKNIGISIFENT